MTEEMTTQTEARVGEIRTIQAVTLEIKTLHDQAQQMALNFAIEIGRRLTEAKSMIAHGGWGDWLKNETSFSKSTANNLMRIFEEYGDKQFSLFGHEAKSQSLGDLTYTQALKLLALPEEEREPFVEDHNLNEMSIRELEKAIQEREESLAEAEHEKVMVLAESASLKEESAKLEAEKLRLQEDVFSAMSKAESLQKELETLKNAPKEVAIETVIDHEAIETAKKELQTQLDQQIQEADTAKEALEKLAAENDELTAMLKMSRDDADLQITQLEKQLQEVKTQDVAIFKGHFNQAQDHINKMMEILHGFEAVGSQEVAEKLKKALRAVLEESLQGVRQ